MFIYAQLDENNVCMAVSQLMTEQNSSDMIPLDFLDCDKLNRKYENGVWGGKPEDE